MNSIAVFATVHPVIWVVWFVGMSVSIAFIIRARAMHRSNVQQRLAKSAQDAAAAAGDGTEWNRSGLI